MNDVSISQLKNLTGQFPLEHIYYVYLMPLDLYLNNFFYLSTFLLSICFIVWLTFRIVYGSDLGIRTHLVNPLRWVKRQFTRTLAIYLAFIFLLLSIFWSGRLLRSNYFSLTDRHAVDRFHDPDSTWIGDGTLYHQALLKNYKKSSPVFGSRNVWKERRTKSPTAYRECLNLTSTLLARSSIQNVSGVVPVSTNTDINNSPGRPFRLPTEILYGYTFPNIYNEDSADWIDYIRALTVLYESIILDLSVQFLTISALRPLLYILLDRQILKLTVIFPRELSFSMAVWALFRIPLYLIPDCLYFLTSSSAHSSDSLQYMAHFDPLNKDQKNGKQNLLNQYLSWKSSYPSPNSLWTMDDWMDWKKGLKMDLPWISIWFIELLKFIGIFLEKMFLIWIIVKLLRRLKKYQNDKEDEYGKDCLNATLEFGDREAFFDSPQLFAGLIQAQGEQQSIEEGHEEVVEERESRKLLYPPEPLDKNSQESLFHLYLFSEMRHRISLLAYSLMINVASMFLLIVFFLTRHQHALYHSPYLFDTLSCIFWITGWIIFILMMQLLIPNHKTGILGEIKVDDKWHRKNDEMKWNHIESIGWKPLVVSVSETGEDTEVAKPDNKPLLPRPFARLVYSPPLVPALDPWVFADLGSDTAIPMSDMSNQLDPSLLRIGVEDQSHRLNGGKTGLTSPLSRPLPVNIIPLQRAREPGSLPIMDHHDEYAGRLTQPTHVDSKKVSPDLKEEEQRDKI